METFLDKAIAISEARGEPEGMRSWRSELARFADEAADLPYGIAIKAKGDDLVAVGQAGIAYERTGSASVAMLERAYTADVASALLFALPFLKKNRYGAANASCAHGGLVISVPEGDAALELGSSFGSDGSDLVVVLAGDHASLDLSESIACTDARKGRTLIAVLGESARFSHTLASHGGGSFYGNIVVSAGRGSRAEFTNLSSLKGGIAKIDAEHVLSGAGAESEMRNMSLVTGGFLDVFNSAVHAASHTTSRIYAAGVAGGDGRIVYRSDIVMKREGTKALSGLQRAKFLAVSPKAEVDAIPMLDVGRKEVECSHSVSVSHLKDSDLHYPMSRGLSREAAAKLVISGLIAPEGPGGQEGREEFLREIDSMTV